MDGVARKFFSFLNEGEYNSPQIIRKSKNLEVAKNKLSGVNCFTLGLEHACG